jgi:DNA-binding CsgD family transcriptional regulator
VVVKLLAEEKPHQNPMSQSGKPRLIDELVRAVPDLVGRNAELTRLDAFLHRLGRGSAALAITGKAGIGKSSLWRYAVRQARNQSYSVLATSPAESERAMPFAGLGDLLQTAGEETLARLPAPQRDAVRVALLQQAPSHTPIRRHGVALGALSALRLMAEKGPVLVAVDDLQWLDAPTLQVLSFIVRRLEGERVGILTTVRQDDPEATPLGEERAPIGGSFDRIDLGPLGIEDLDVLIARHLGANLSMPVLQQLYATSGGNPFYALEIARYLLSRQTTTTLFGDNLPVPPGLRELVRSRLSRLPAATREALLIVASLSHPKESEVAAAMANGASRAAIERAKKAHLLDRSGDRLTFTHPLIASVVYGDASPERLRQMHSKLASVVGAPDDRVRHLALATVGQNATVANELDAAAGRAAGRGAPETAADLMQLACDLTPTRHSDLRLARVIKAADLLVRVGEVDRARELLRPLTGEGHAHAIRASVLQRLALIARWREGMAAAEVLLRAALAESTGAQPLTAAITRDLVWVLVQSGDAREAARLAKDLVAEAERLEDRTLRGSAEVLLMMATCLLGKGVRPEQATRAAALLVGSDLGADSRTRFIDPLLTLGVVLRWTDDFATARSVFLLLLDQISERQDESGMPAVLYQLAQLECLAGNWDKASDYEQELARALRHAGQQIGGLALLVVNAELQALRGYEDDARSSAQAALAQAERYRDSRFMMSILALLGFIELSHGDADACLRYMGQLRAMWEKSHYAEPSMFRFQSDEIEALIALGRLDEAADLTRTLESQGKLLDRPWAKATSGRCRALLFAARGDLGSALAAIDGAVEAHDRLEQPFELGRTLLVRGSIKRRLKDRRAARETLERARGIFDRLGAARWSAKARTELSRIGGRQRSEGALTPTERAVAELVAGGATNREIATRLFVSVKTVEANLSKIYQKLGVRSRTELAVRTAAQERKT